jgi:TRAP-type transport system periplasmic protein
MTSMRNNAVNFDRHETRPHGRARRFLLAAALICASGPAFAQETIQLTIAAGNLETFLWVKHLKETFIPTVDAELEKTGELKIEWTQAYGGTLVKLGSEVPAFQQGIMDVGHALGVANPDQLGIFNLAYAMPFGPQDPQTVTEAAEAALQAHADALADVEERTGIVYIGGGISIEDYNIGATKKIERLEDLQGLKISGAGPNLVWLRGTGAVGVQGGFPTYYNGIQTGLFDGYIGWMTANAAAKLYEVAPNWNKVHLGAMYIGGLGVAKNRWDSFSDATKDAFRTAATAFSEAYHTEQAALHEAARKTMLDNGGVEVELPAEERSKWIAAMENPATEWIAAAEARGEPARAILQRYQENLQAGGFSFERDYLSD